MGKELDPVELYHALLVGAVSFSAAVTATVIILKRIETGGWI